MIDCEHYRPCALVPYYNHPQGISDVVNALCHIHLPVIVVDDASSPLNQQVVDELVIALRNDMPASLVEVVRHNINQGKGASVITGLRFALRNGYTHALQVDADAQHDMSQLSSIIDQSKKYPKAFVVGQPIYESVPLLRYYSRYLTHLWVWINSLSFQVKDTMCGFRIYPVEAILAIVSDNEKNIAQRMGFDIEICVRSIWKNIQIINFPVKVKYDEDGISHFRPFMDNVEISWMHTRCFFGMLKRLPQLLLQKTK